MNNPFRENAKDDSDVQKHRITEQEVTKRQALKEREETKRAHIKSRDVSPAWYLGLATKCALVFGLAMVGESIYSMHANKDKPPAPHVCVDTALYVSGSVGCEADQDGKLDVRGDSQYLMCTCRRPAVEQPKAP